MSPQDIALLDRWIERKDADAFTELVHRYAGLVYGACLRVLRNPADAEEVAQECFLRVAEAPTKVESSLAGWLHTTATRRSISRLRSDSRREAREHAYASGAEDAPDVGWDDVREHIDAAIDGLPEDVRIPLVEHFLAGRSYEAIGQDLGVTRQAVSRRVQKGIESVRGELRRKGIPVAVGALSLQLAEHASVSAAPASLLKQLCAAAIGGVDQAVIQAAALTGASSLALKLAPLAMVVVLVGGFFAVRSQLPTTPDEIVATTSPEVFASHDGDEPPVAPETQANSASVDDSSESEIADVNTSPVEADDTNELEPIANEVLPNGDTIAGVVLNRRGEPVSSANVYAISREETRNPVIHEFETKSDGIFNFSGIPSGSYTVVASHQDYSEGHLDWLPSGSQGLRIILPNYGKVYGRVFSTVDRSPIAEFRVRQQFGHVDMMMFEGTRPREVLYPFTNNEGNYMLDNVKPGATTLFAYADGYGPGMVQIAAVAEGGTVGPVDIYLQPEAMLIGFVVDDNGEPVKGASIQTSMVDGAKNRGHSSPLVHSGKRGEFEIPGLTAGDFVFDVVHPEFVPGQIQVRLDAGLWTEKTVVLYKGSRLKGIVYAGGVVAPGTYLELWEENAMAKYVKTNSKGIYAFEHVPAGEYRLIVKAPGDEKGRETVAEYWVTLEDSGTQSLDIWL